MNGNFTHKAQEAIMNAQNLAQSNNHQHIDALHLLSSLLSQQDSIIITLLQKVGANIDDIIKKAKGALNQLPLTKTPQSFGQFYLTQDMAKVLDQARQESVNMQDEFISVEHLFLALMSAKTKAKEILDKTSIFTGPEGEIKKLDYNLVLTALAEIRGGARITDPDPEAKYQVIEKYTDNLTTQAKEGKLDPVIGRENETRRLMQVLSRRTKNNPVLIGEAGVGKTAIIEGLARKIVKKDVPESLKDKEIISLSLGTLVAGTKYRGEFEDRVRALLKEVKRASGKYILFIDELHTLVGAGGAEGAIDASNLLKPALARGELKAIGATTPKEYQKYIEKDGALERRFQPVYTAEPSVEDTIAILRGIKEKYEVHHGLRIKDSALKSAAELAARYITDRFLPDKAVDLMDEAMSSARLEIESEPAELEELKKNIQKLEIEKQAIKNEKNSSKRLSAINRTLADLKEKVRGFEMQWKSEKELIQKIKDLKKEIDNLSFKVEQAERVGDLQEVAEIKYGQIPESLKEIAKSERKLVKLQKQRPILKEEIGEEEIARIVSKWTGIPITSLMEEEIAKLANMENILAKRVIGQAPALKAISSAIRRSRAGIAEENRPMGSFIFLGPTGVGKTETAKALASFLFNDENALIRLDMSEYMEKHTVSKIIGSPPGYIGYDEGGQLTEKIRRRPYSVVLLDEVEKSHPDIFNVLLQVLEDGRLTDAKGRVASFKNSIIIMTSNIGSQYIEKMGELGFNVGNKETKPLREKIMESLRDYFRPEFLNRLDEIIIFNYLGKPEIERIVENELEKFFIRLKAKNIKTKVSDSVKLFLVEKGFDPRLGARPLKRIIQKEILDPLALDIVSGKIGIGSELFIDKKDNQIVFKSFGKIRKK